MGLLVLLLLVGTLPTGCLTSDQRDELAHLLFDEVPAPEPVAVAQEEPVGEWELPDVGSLPSEGRLGRQFRGLTRVPRELARSIHGPYSQRECRECHEGRRSQRLVAEGDDLCFRCHDSSDYAGDVVHGPLGAGYCIGCHDPHRSPNTLLLVWPQAEICRQCHDEATFELAEHHEVGNGDECLRCHNPHAAARRYLLNPGVGS